MRSIPSGICSVKHFYLLYLFTKGDTANLSAAGKKRGVNSLKKSVAKLNHEKEVKFNEADLIVGMREALAHAKGKLTLKTTQVSRRTLAMLPRTIARIRRQLKASTPVFAAYLNVTPDTDRSWEKNRRQPSGAALRLLQITDKNRKSFGLRPRSLRPP